MDLLSTATHKNKSTSWAGIGLAMAALIPIAVSEFLNNWHPTPHLLPILLIGVIIGARRQWPLWSLWWLSWAFFTIISAALFGQPSIGRPPIIFTYWKLVFSVALLFAGLILWQRGDGFQAAFTLFPCSLELTRLTLFDDIPVEETSRFLFMRVATALIYAGVVILITQKRSRRARWWFLVVGTLLYLITILATSFPICLVFALYPAYLPVMVFLALGPLTACLAFDCYRARHHLSISIRTVSLLALILSITGLLTPWFTGDALLTSAYTPLAAQIPGSRLATIIDTDLSHDDYVAILYLLQRPDVDVHAITVANGVAHVEPGLENVRRLLALADREDIPIAAGSPTPLIGNNAFPASLRLIVNLGLRPALPTSTATATPIAAPELIRQQVTSSSTPVNLIALGPLTNIAQALQDDPALTSQLGTIFVSGGAVYVENPANPNAAEWNLFVDPHAADLVFRSGANLVLVPLDVTDLPGPRPILFSRSFVKRFTATAQGRESKLIAHIMNGWLLATPNAYPAPLWDVPAAAIAIEPNICADWRDLSIRVVHEPAEIAGRTVVDEKGQPNVRVCLGGDQAAFEASYLATAR